MKRSDNAVSKFDFCCFQVTKAKKWREISSALNIGSSGSAGFTLRKNYIKYLFNYECRFDRGNMDPAPVIAQLELMSGKKDRKSSSSPGQLRALEFSTCVCYSPAFGHVRSAKDLIRIIPPPALRLHDHLVRK